MSGRSPRTSGARHSDVEVVRAGDHPGREEYERARDVLRDELAATTEPVRLAKRTSNLFRPRERGGPLLDVGAFSGVLEVDPRAGTADVLGMTTYEDLVEATLACGVMPLVVPQLRTITLGGAVAGLGIESSSFRSGLPHESVIEMEILTGAGDIVLARADNEHADLFWAFPNSYGTLGYALRIVIEVEPVRPFVALRHLRYDTPEALFVDLERMCADGEHDAERIDFLDGTAFSLHELYLTIGTFTATAPGSGTDTGAPARAYGAPARRRGAPTGFHPSDYTGRRIYYRSIRERERDLLTVHDYLWRWDTDWFWCSRAFGAQNRVVRALWPKRWLRSDVYWRLVALERRLGITRRVERLRRRPPSEPIVQDVEVPVDRAAGFLRGLFDDPGITPVWLCPLRQRRPAPWDLYPLDPDMLYVNFGFWGSVPIAPGDAHGDRDRRIERAVTAHDGRKSLYSTSYYPPEEFWELYGGARYREVKRRYDPEGRLLDLYEKCVGRR